ncbi:MAG TPA: hypothetical protein VIY52_17625, partial [Streptosporangiaceae bacterium]
QNYDDWAVPGWSYENVLSSFKRMEDWEDGATALRGSGGPVKVTRQKDLTPASQVFIEALAASTVPASWGPPSWALLDRWQTVRVPVPCEQP